MAEKNLTQTPQKESVTKLKTETQTNEPNLPGAEYLAASPAMASMAAGEMPPIEPQKHAIAMNRVIGNQETTKRIQRSGLHFSGMRTIVQKSSAVIQRDDGPTATVNLPLGYETATTKNMARFAIDGIVRDLQDVITEVGDSPVENPIPELRAKQADLNGDVPIPQQQADELNALFQKVQVANDFMVMQIRQAVQSAAGNLQKNPGIGNIEGNLNDALAKASHEAFEGAANEEKIAGIKDALGKIKTYNAKVGQVADWAREAAEMVNMVQTAKTLKTFKDITGGVGGLVGRVQSVFEAASDIATVFGVSREKAGDLQQSINQIRAAMNLTKTAMSLVKDVPGMGLYWNGYVVPMTNACLEALQTLGEASEKIGLESILYSPIGPSGAPLIDPMQKRFFPGGQEMLDFMYQLVNGGSPSMPASVKSYFYKFHKQFSAGAEEKMPEEPSWLNPLPELFGDPELYAWVEKNKDMLWGQLYGSLPHSLRGD
jgi:methyl-accepting chemotaxis protein